MYIQQSNLKHPHNHRYVPLQQWLHGSQIIWHETETAMGSMVLKLRSQSKSVVNDCGEQNRVDFMALVPPFLLTYLLILYFLSGSIPKHESTVSFATILSY